MATDYDAPRRTESDEVSEDSLEELKARRNEAQSAVVDIDESDTAESFELPGADLSEEVLTVRVIPKQADEFTCSSCFLVHHRSRLASESGGQLICMGLCSLISGARSDLQPRSTVSPRSARPASARYAKRGQDPVRPSRTDQPVRRRIVRVVEYK